MPVKVSQTSEVTLSFDTISDAQANSTGNSQYILVEGTTYKRDASGVDLTTGDGANWTNVALNDAEVARDAALAAQTGAETAQASAETARDKSQKWAEEAEDTEVETGQYSALHHAAKAGDAQIAAEAAQTAAETAQTAAETAETGATTAAAIVGAYSDTTLAAALTTALGATTLGDTFAATGEDVDYVGLYEHASGPTADEIAKITKYDFVIQRLLSESPPGYYWAVVDGSGGAVMAVRESDDAVEMVKVAPQEVAFENASLGDFITAPFFPWGISDGAGNVALGVDEDGATHVGDLKVMTINGTAAGDFGGGLAARAAGRFLTEDAMMVHTGQSLGEGSTPATSITTAQEYDNVGFAARAADYSVEGLAALTVSNCGVSGRGENPMFGTAGNIKALIEAENGVDETELDYRLIGVNTAYGGYKIADLEKGTAPYADGVAAVTRGKALADAAGRSFAARAVTWTQGEGDAVAPTPFATYRDALIQLAEDYDTDLKAVTGQAEPVYLISYQTATRDLTIARAQLEAMQTSPLIVMACPMYQFNYGDSVHIDAASSQWLGGYYGLAYKRTVVDGQVWEPLMPIASQISGSVIDLTFNKSGLVFDTTNLPPQTNQGFSVEDGGGTPQTISTVEIIQPNRVRITLSSGTPAAGWAVKYAHNTASGRTDSFVGGQGNLRDNAGDILTYEGNRLDNWSVIFNWTL